MIITVKFVFKCISITHSTVDKNHLQVAKLLDWTLSPTSLILLPNCLLPMSTSKHRHDIDRYENTRHTSRAQCCRLWESVECFEGSHCLFGGLPGMLLFHPRGSRLPGRMNIVLRRRPPIKIHVCLSGENTSSAIGHPSTEC